jgi:hypothetical protein
MVPELVLAMVALALRRKIPCDAGPVVVMVPELLEVPGSQEGRGEKDHQGS